MSDEVKTLRDEMAMAALAGFTSGGYWQTVDNQECANVCYEVADAMLAARKKGGAV